MNTSRERDGGKFCPGKIERLDRLGRDLDGLSGQVTRLTALPPLCGSKGPVAPAVAIQSWLSCRRPMPSAVARRGVRATREILAVSSIRGPQLRERLGFRCLDHP